MAASPSGPRRQRFVRAPVSRPPVLSPLLAELLGYVERAGLISLAQLAILAGIPPKRARRLMRAAYDAGWVEVIPVTRAALCDAGTAADISLLQGSAPNVYSLTRSGQAVLGGLEDPPRTRPGSPYRLHSPHIAHELAVTDLLAWLLLTERAQPGFEVMRWHRSAEAVIDLKRDSIPHAVRPDAWFTVRIGERYLVGLCEADRSTEKGLLKWGAKLAAYQALFAGGRLKEATGFANARILVTAPDGRRRDALAGLIQKNAEPALAGRFWLAEGSALSETDWSRPLWRRPGEEKLSALLPGKQCDPGP